MSSRALSALTRCAVVCVALLLLISGRSAEASARSQIPHGPQGLRFYTPPKELPKRPGTAIWTRPAGAQVGLSDAKRTSLILYSSRTPRGESTAVSGSVSVPRGKPPRGGWPVVSWAYGASGVADVCAASRTDKARSGTDGTAIDNTLNAWLRAGYAIVRTDYQGLGTPGPFAYLIGTAEGRAVVDIVAAARQLDPRIGRRFLIAGHSEGGHAALSAAGLANRWQPDLRLRGTVALAPASHILEQANLLPLLRAPSALTALASLIVSGAATQSGKIEVSSILSDEVLGLYPRLQSECFAQLAAPDALGGIAPSNLFRAGADLTALRATLATMNPAVRSSAPILIAQGSADATVFPIFTQQLSRELTKLGNRVSYKEYRGMDHSTIVNAARASTLAFFRTQLAQR